MKNKFTLAIIAFVIATLSTTALAFAADAKPTEKQVSGISNHCGAIHQNLKDLQRTDARTRTYFGAIYETASSKYLKPLNLRIVNNDMSNANLLKLQSDFAEARTAFSEDYIKYSKSLEGLISIDCRLEPTEFYEKLISTREKRAIVASDVKKLNDLLSSIVKSAELFKESLK